MSGDKITVELIKTHVQCSVPSLGDDEVKKHTDEICNALRHLEKSMSRWAVDLGLLNLREFSAGNYNNYELYLTIGTRLSLTAERISGQLIDAGFRVSNIKYCKDSGLHQAEIVLALPKTSPLPDSAAGSQTAAQVKVARRSKRLSTRSRQRLGLERVDAPRSKMIQKTKKHRNSRLRRTRTLHDRHTAAQAQTPNVLTRLATFMKSAMSAFSRTESATLTSAEKVQVEILKENPSLFV